MTAKQAYNKERARVRSLLTRMENQGFLHATEMLPKAPKKITTASVRALRKISREYVAEHTQYFVDYETGEFVSGKSAYNKLRAGRNPFKSWTAPKEKFKQVKTPKQEDIPQKQTKQRKPRQKKQRMTPEQEAAYIAAQHPENSMPAPVTPPEITLEDNEAVAPSAVNAFDAIIQIFIDDINAAISVVRQPGVLKGNQQLKETTLQDLINFIKQKWSIDNERLAKIINSEYDPLHNALEGIQFNSKDWQIQYNYDQIIKIIERDW